MNRFLSRALSILFLFGSALPFAVGREPQPTAAAQPLPTGSEIEELAKLKLLKDLTPRLQSHTSAERRAIYLAIAVERQLLPSAEAADLLQILGGIAGFDRAARQLCGYGSP